MHRQCESPYLQAIVSAANVSQECNIILTQSYEYREPTPNAVKAAAESSSGTSSTATLKVDMTSRFVGLIVVPGQYITKIEVDGP